VGERPQPRGEPQQRRGTARRLSLCPPHKLEGEWISESRRSKSERGVWQRRYWEHTLRDERDFARHTDYIHFNPVKHGLVSRVQDWPHSSFRRMGRLGIYPQDWAGDNRDGAAEFGER